jgi:hypothetical protein
MFNSFERQDEFIYYLFNAKKDGYYLDIAGNDPIRGSNTYIFDKMGWNGRAYDIVEVFKHMWERSDRKGKMFILDATTESLTNNLKESFSENNGLVDYVSLDVDVGGAFDMNLSAKVLPRILDSGIRFKAITIEHEAFKFGPSDRDYMRDLLLKQNYTLLFSNLLFPNSSRNWEDWWIDEKYFDQDLLSIKSDSIDYNSAVEKIKLYFENKKL